MNLRSLPAIVVAWGVIGAGTGAAQVDPLLFLKGTRPNVIVAIDLSSRMLRDARGIYHDPLPFERTGLPFEASIGVDGGNTDRVYRRRYDGLSWSAPASGVRGTAGAIEIVGDRDSAFALFDARTRLGRARLALARAIDANLKSTGFGLITTRQASPRVDIANWSIVALRNPPAGDPTDTGVEAQWRSGVPTVGTAGSAAPPAGPIVAADATAGNSALRRLLDLPPGATGALLPAGSDSSLSVDAPIGLLIDDLRSEASRLGAADRSCRNTVVVLIAAGADPSLGRGGLADRARPLLDINGRRVPVHVIALAPDPLDAAELAGVAAVTGGRYVEIPPASFDHVPAGEPVPEITHAVNFAVQHAFCAFADLNLAPSPTQPLGRASYSPTGGPIVGTVNLENASDAGGALLLSTRVTGPNGEVIPQRSNVMFAAGFELPGFLGRLSAYRVYRPVPDATRITGHRFVADGTRLWAARTPAPPARNIFTVVPGVGVVPFRAASAPMLAPFLGVADAAAMVESVRERPFGPVVNSTPALLEPPSMPYADPAYRAFADAHRGRRAVAFVGASDGMMHAFDARTGIEVWAVIPFNLLPKLKRLPEGAPVDGFPYFVEASPRLADIMVQGEWRTFLFFGEGPGGTFYQAFDVTLDGLADVAPADRDQTAALIEWFADPDRIGFKWSFPRYDQFDPAMGSDGDLAVSATEAEKSVGETWSTPVIGRAGGADGPFVAIVGSGGSTRTRERQPNRGGVRAGTRLYMLDAGSGAIADTRDVGSDGIAEDQDGCPADGCTALKNALQGDPTGTGPPDTGAVATVYSGDLDGRLWRFDVVSGSGPPAFAGQPRLLFGAGAGQPILGGIGLLAGIAGQSYLFLGTGGDALLRSGVAGGYRLLGLVESPVGVVRQFDRLLRTAGLDGIDETPAASPSVAGAVVYFATTSRASGSACQAAEASLYTLTLGGGAAFDSNGDRRVDASDEPLVSRVRLGRAVTPVTADRHVFLATGDRVQVFGDPEGFGEGAGFAGVRIVSWRELR